MTPRAGDLPGTLPRLAAGSTLDLAIKKLSQAGQARAVIIDATGKPIGQVALQAIMAAL